MTDQWKQLKETITEIKENNKFEKEDVTLMCQFLLNYMGVLEKEMTGWIPVSERLPEKYTYTLWCASSGYVRSDYFNVEFWEDAKKYCYEVLAWMPLPEPYKPRESEDKE